LPIKSSFATEENKSGVSNTSNTKLVEDLIEKAKQLYNKGDFPGALNITDKILDVDKNNIDSMYIKGNALDYLGKPEWILVWYDKALNQTISTNETDIDVVSNKVYVLGTILKEYLKTNHEHKGLICTTVEVYKQTGDEQTANQYQQQLSTSELKFK
jgi:Tfp pilus assembly protein PilF